MSEQVRHTLADFLKQALGPETVLEELELLGGGTSQEIWGAAASLRGERLDLVVRCGSEETSLFPTLELHEEFRLLERASESGVSVPEPYWYAPDIGGKPALVMRRLEGETIGRRIVKKGGFARAREYLPTQMAREVARIHATPFDDLGFLSRPTKSFSSPALFEVRRLEEILDAVGEPHPVLELGLLWLKKHAPPATDLALVHGDFRLGNFMVNDGGIAGVLDWELAHAGDPAEDLGWACVREWRFGEDALLVGGVGNLDAFLEEYARESGQEISCEKVFYWEVLGNVRWAIITLTQARRHLDGQQRSIELASLGRRCAEVELEILSLIEMGGHLRTEQRRSVS